MSGVNWKIIHIPESCKGVDIVVGVDEAGRGPVLGPLVYAAAFWPVSEDAEIQKMGFNDSKQLKESDRERFFSDIRSHPSIGWIIEEISATDISKEMLRSNPVSLNALSYNAVCRMLRKIVDPPAPTAADNNVSSQPNDVNNSNDCGDASSREQKITKSSIQANQDEEEYNAPQITDVFVDTVGDADYYKSRLIHNLGGDFAQRYIIEKKADAKYKVVGAASIVAKVHRDTTLKTWQWPEPSVKLDLNFGSGYPGDENCAKWLTTAQVPVFGFPSLVRFSWSTARECLNSHGACTVQWECDEDDAAAGTADIKNFFADANASGSKRAKRTPFYEQKKLKHIAMEDLRN